jgi:hypothetical protein
VSRISRAQGALVARLQAANAADGDDPAASISYQPAAGGNPTDLTGRAWVGRTVFSRRDPAQRGPSVEYGDRDYLIPAAELPGEPARGDRVTERIGEWLVTFECMVPSLEGEPAWRWSDPARTVYRVHTKEVSRRPA